MLFDHLGTILGVRPSAALAASFRRLFFFSHALALQDLKGKLERGDGGEPRVLPLAEKVQRIKDQEARLTGVVFTPNVSPSYSLIDKAVQQAEEGVVQYIELTKCTSRQQETLAEKTTPALSFNAEGDIKVTKTTAKLETNISGESRLRLAFQRRALAYDLAGVASYQVQERWAQKLFDKLHEAVPAGYRQLTVDQLIAADQALWVHVSNETASVMNTLVHGEKAVDAAINKWAEHPEVRFHILPLPVPPPAPPPRQTPYDRPPKGKGKDKDGSQHTQQQWQPNQPKGKGKTKDGGKDGGKTSSTDLPQGCVAFDGDKPICRRFNVGTCRSGVKAPKRCSLGYHICWKQGCHKPFPATECTHN